MSTRAAGLIFILGCGLIVLTQGASRCYECINTILPPGLCNKTSCDLRKLNTCEYSTQCNDTLPCMCLTTFVQNEDGNITVMAWANPEIIYNDLELIYKNESINGLFKKMKYGNQWNHECGLRDCNFEVLLEPYYYLNGTFMHKSKVDPPPIPADYDYVSKVVVPVVVAVVLLIIVSLAITLVLYRKHNSSHSSIADKSKYGHRQQSSSLQEDSYSWDGSDQCSLSTYKTKVDSASSSVATQYTRGSSGGDNSMSLLPIRRRSKIASGRYAKVYEAVLVEGKNTSVPVSVKAFSLRNYGAWRQEIDMLSESWMHHENIIEYYTAEQRTIRNHLEYWLITAYYKQGNLANFLISQSLSWPRLVGMILSIARGLEYLHAERDSLDKPKVAIAHRDIKSTNILVKDDLNSCVIADFGLSLKLYPTLTKEDCANAGQVGTPRYMAPELLERLMILSDLDSFKRADVYAMALVVWEMMNRCEYGINTALPYMAAYGNMVKEYPTKYQMLMLVCKNKMQPEIKPKWYQHEGMSRLCVLLSETWEYVAEERISAGCVVERMKNLQADLIADEKMKHADDIVDEKKDLLPPDDIIDVDDALCHGDAAV